LIRFIVIGWDDVRVTDAARDSSSLEQETQWVELAIRGDADAFAKLYDSYIDRLYRFIYFRVGNEQMAEDLSSQVFLKAWENLGRYEMRGLSFGAWLFRIARNLVIDHYRTKKDHASLEEDGSHSDPALMVDGSMDAKFEAEWLRSAMKQLTDDQRTVLTLKFIEGLDTAEIAEIMGKRQGAVRALQLRGLQALAEILEAHDE
jgi:RNA polymerase sigma-70 factor (ECF subfamily)